MRSSNNVICWTAKCLKQSCWSKALFSSRLIYYELFPVGNKASVPVERLAVTLTTFTCGSIPSHSGFFLSTKQ